MLLCAGVLQPIAGGKGTKRDQTPFLAQHSELGTGTEMFMAPAQGNQSSSVTADVGQEHGECSASSFPCSQNTSPGTPCVSCNGIPCGTGKVSQGSLCPCPEPDKMMTMAAQLQPWLWKGISTGRGEEQLLPQVTWPMGLEWGCSPRGDQSEPCRADPIRVLGVTPLPTDTTCRFHQWTSPALWRTEQLRANSRPKAPAPQKSGQWGKNYKRKRERK